MAWVFGVVGFGCVDGLVGLGVVEGWDIWAGGMVFESEGCEGWVELEVVEEC